VNGEWKGEADDENDGGEREKGERKSKGREKKRTYPVCA